MEVTHSHNKKPPVDPKNFLFKASSLITDGIIIQEPKGEVLFANHSVAKLLGARSPKQLLGLSIGDIAKSLEIRLENGRILPLSKLPGSLASRGKTPFPLVVRFEFKNKKVERWSEIKSTPIIDKNGKVRFVINIFRDVTRQRQIEEFITKSKFELTKRAEEQTKKLKETNKFLKFEIKERLKAEKRLNEEKSKMEMIYKTTKEGITLYDENCRVVYVNPYLKKLFGVKRDIVGQRRIEIARNRRDFFKYKMERSDDSLETERTCLSGIPVTNVSIKVHSRPVRFLEADYIPIIGNKRKVRGVVGSFRDVTLQKKQSMEITGQLQETERERNRLEAVFNNVEEGVHVVDSRGRIIQANAACEPLSGRSEREMVGKHYWDMFGCHDQHGGVYPDFNPMSKVLATKDAVPYDEHLHVDAEGRERWVGVSYTPIVDNSGEVEQIVSVIRDITSMKELEKAKSEFVSVASHELRTPLTVINGYLSLILSGDLGKIDESKEAYLAALGKVFNETKRLTKLVEELLNVSRIEENRLRLTLRKIAFVDMVGDVVGEFRPIAQRKGIFLECPPFTETGHRLYVIGDKYKLKQVLVNLLDNAVKFTPEGGKVKVECQKRNRKVLVNIEDTGNGISPQMIPHIFEKFQQISGPYIKENQGTGLGLFIVRSLVEMHKGQVRVESKIGQGSRFTFSLPIVADGH